MQVTRILALALTFSAAVLAGGALACSLPGVNRPARCSVLKVPEDPDHPNRRTLSIHIAVIPATSGRALPDPLVPLMGGPGEDAISAASLFAERFAPLLENHDLLLVDQRGTGLSAPLNCHLFSLETATDNVRDFFPIDAVQRCRRQLEARADLTKYTYAYFATDLEKVRQALGYGPLNLYAASYGTRAAQAFLRQYPQSARTVFLGSVVPIDSGGPLAFAKTEQTALEHTFANCAAEPACQKAFPDLRGEFQKMLARLDAGSVRVPVPGSRSARVTLPRGRVVEWFRSELYRPSDSAALPWIIHRASAGDWSPIVAGILTSSRNADEDLSWGVFFSITCSEDIPFVTKEDADRETRGTWLGGYRLHQQHAACEQWPKTPLPSGYHEPISANVPTLFVTGDLDGGTPLWFTDRVSKGFSNQATAVIHGQGHTEWNDCIAELYGQLVRSGSLSGVNTKCPGVPLPPFKITSAAPDP
jgi:pimeloyl-ACP methyl ester carboxylesterase